MPSADSRPDNQEPGGDDTSQNGASNKDLSSSDTSNKDRSSSDASNSHDVSAAILQLDDSAAPMLGVEHQANGQTNPGNTANKESPGIANGSAKPVEEALSLSKTSLSKAQPVKPISASKTSIKSKNSASLGFQAHEINDLSHDMSRDNGFHTAPKTVILPAVTGAAINKSPLSNNTPQSVKRRFTVTAQNGVPSSLQTSQNSVGRPHSLVSNHSHGQDHVPGVHFKQSNSSIPKSEQHHLDYHRLASQISEEFIIANDGEFINVFVPSYFYPDH